MHMALHVRSVITEAEKDRAGKGMKRELSPCLATYRKNKFAYQKGTPTRLKNKDIEYKSADRTASGFDIPPAERYAAQSAFGSNRGSAAIEAVCMLPIFIFACWVFYSIGQIYITENIIYQSVMNTAAELAEYAYLAEDTPTLASTAAANIRLRSYLPEDGRLERYVTGGADGLLILQPVSVDDEGFLTLRLRYRVQVPVPFFQKLSMPIQVQVRQKAYTGYPGGSPEAEEGYVYLTDYQSVYHVSRSCTHLSLSVHSVSAAALRTRYPELDACSYCGDQTAAVYYITDTGECYHTSAQCSELKRTVRRVPISEARGYAPCSRCGQ